MFEPLEFHVHEILTHKPIGRLDPSAFAFNEPVWGAGEFNGSVTIPAGKDVTSLKRRTIPDQVELYITQGSTYHWGGIINYRSRKPGTQTLSIKAQHWKAWLYTRIYPGKLVYASRDQYQMAYDLWDFAANDVGCPTLFRSSGLSGTLRQFTVEPFKSVGQLLDEFGSRDGGFEWSVSIRLGAQTGLPEPFLELWEQGAERSQRSALFLDQKTTHNNISVGDIAEDATERRPRVWATGDGGWPDQLFVKDEDPELATNTILLREAASNYGGVVLAATLFDHARSDRVARNVPLSTIPVDHPVDQPNIKDYRVGDRARLRINDEWENIDLRGVRIVDRAVSKQGGQATIATVLLDLTDVKDV